MGAISEGSPLNPPLGDLGGLAEVGGYHFFNSIKEGFRTKIRVDFFIITGENKYYNIKKVMPIII